MDEIMWQRGAKWMPRGYELRDPRFFVFDRVSRRKIRLLDADNMAEGIELEGYKFIVHLPHLETGLPIRGGIARVAAWSYLCKNYTIKDWLSFAEVFGMPLRLGKYQAGAQKEDIAVLEKLLPVGLKVEQSVVRDKLNLPDPADDAELPAPQQQTEPPVVPTTVDKNEQPVKAAKNLAEQPGKDME